MFSYQLSVISDGLDLVKKYNTVKLQRLMMSLANIDG